MGFDLANLIDCLQLRQAGATAFDGDNLALEYHRIFGGQILGQSIRALQGTAGDKVLKSFSQRFPREGDAAQPMHYDVTTEHTGRTFATSTVRASQAAKPVAVMSASLHIPEDGIDRQDGAPPIDGPDAIEPAELHLIPWDVRVVGGTDLGTRESRPASYRFWMRIAEFPDGTDVDDPWLHQALLAHATDLTVIGTALLPIDGLSQDDTGTKFHSAVTAHSMWFHRPVRLDEWLLVDQSSPIMSEGRAFGRADVWTQDGRLVASFAQESMVRLLA